MDLTHGNSPFPATRWTEVVKVCQKDDVACRQRALGGLCQAYWYPLYAFARRLGRSRHDAQDLAQGFFCYALERDLFAAADREVGKLRTFLLRVFQRYIGDADERERALKRGGGLEVFSLEFQDGEQRYVHEPLDGDTPETLYQRAWAMAVLRAALEELRTTEQHGGGGEVFNVLEAFLDPDAKAEGSYPEAAAALGVTVENVRQMVSRLRKKFRVCLRQQIAATLNNPSSSQIDEELSDLKAALRH
ncbi:MAG: DNA-directed polymerase specialized sigma subunit, sigma24 [Verrucomicrobiaceae bacterium]|nr:DNA-directed polymerase specialized sigma subunit, sigma24 [Verrucomicrobiaceae bacterium]